MRVIEVQVPLALLIDRSLTPAAKLVWIAQCLNDDDTKHVVGTSSPTRLSDRIGVTAPTVRDAIAQLAASDWRRAAAQHPSRRHRSPSVLIPIDLLTDRALRPRARMLYGILQRTPGFRHPKGKATYTTLADLAHTDNRTIRKSIRELAQAGWIEAYQAHRRDFVHFTLLNPILIHARAELARVKRRIDKAPYLGEAIMRELLTLLVDSDEFEDDAAPGFLVNPLSDERLQLDRYYPPSVAFEFNGPQHYEETERFPEKDVAAQKVRDLIKTGICAVKGITLVVVHPEDLSLVAMREKVGDLLPLRDLERHGMIIHYLESLGRAYRNAARR